MRIIFCRPKEPSIVQSDLEMVDYDTEEMTCSINNNDVIQKLAAYEPSLPRVNRNQISIHNNLGYERYIDNDDS